MKYKNQGNRIIQTQQTNRSKRGHYVPQISAFLVSVLYHEGRRRGMPMTRLVDQLLSEALRDSSGWLCAQHARQVQAQSNLNP